MFVYNIRYDPDILAEEIGKLFGIDGLKANMISHDGLTYEAGLGFLKITLGKAVSLDDVNAMMAKARTKVTDG